MPEEILRVEDVRKTFDGTVANDGVTFGIESGEFHGIIGPNGSGKTTLFNTVTGFHSPDSGRILFGGEDITGESPDAIARRGLVRTFQIPTPFENLSVRQNLLSAYAGGIRAGVRVPEAQHRRADDILDLLELDAVADNEASDISGGQQKLLELGRALMLEPDCLLLDEPTASVNPSTEQRLLANLREINDAGTTIVLIEHDMNVIEAVTDQITVLSRGQIVAQGNFTDVTARTEVREAYLGKSPITPPGRDGSGESDEDRKKTVAGRSVVTDRGRENSQTSREETAQRAEQSVSTATGKEDESPRLVGTDIVAGYGNQQILHSVSVRSHDGITCLFGPNGSGKSTLLNVLAGMIPAWSGTIEYGDRTLTDRQSHEFIRAGVTMVPQDDMVFGGLTVRENLQLGGTVVADTDTIDERIDEVLDSFPALEGKLSKTVNSLSGGQQTMVGFGRAMMSGGDVYLLDEPTSSLAPSVTDDIFEMIEQLVSDGAQVILVEQNVTEALPHADHVYLLAQGEIQYDGSPAALQDESRLLRDYLGMD